MSEENFITLELEGTEQDQGHVRVSYLLDQLQTLQATLNAIHKSLSRKKVTTLYYRIVSATHNSPLKLVVEPVDKEEGTEAQSVSILHDRFFDEVSRIEKGSSPSEDMGNEAVESLGKLIAFDKRRFKRVAFQNRTKVVELTDQGRISINRYLSDEESSRGSLVGKLDALNFHGTRKKKFYIYPQIGPTKVECVFSSTSEIKEQIMSALESEVRVFGRKHYRKNQKFPHLIEVDFLEKVDDAKSTVPHLAHFKGTVDFGKPLSETLEEIGESWE